MAGTGQELCTESDWNGALKDDITLLASAGEEYVGLRKESSIHGEFVLRYGIVHQLYSQDVMIVNLSSTLKL